MQRINTATKAVDLFGPGKHGFKDGDLGLGIQPTDFDAAFFNALQEELAHLVESQGGVPTPGVYTQVATAIQAMINASAAQVPPGTPLMWPVPTPPAWALVRDGSAMSRAAYADLYDVLCPTRNMTTVNGTKNLTSISTTADLYIGMPIEGAGIAAGAQIESILTSTTATMTINATASAAVPVRLFYYGYGSGGSATTFGLPDDRGLFERGLDTSRGYEKTTLNGTTTNALNTLTGLSSTKGLYVGMALSAAAGIPGGTTITEITSATAIKMSANASATGARDVIFTGGQIGNERGDTFQGHWHEPDQSLGTSSASGGSSSSWNIGSSSTMYYALVRNAITDGLNGTPRTGPETRGKFRDYLPIIAY